ncbi:alpha/beta hydrolase [Agathobaculum sp. NTUH-O15-33]|uniref:alpha/beta fold hydrolase n=1 Tax=Agathobaculum sp. NTUH-O15-33 TaxID=3079302 RepID=UPI002958CF1E|nr:alpha/beta hydrolase [Agathobaculum sp. NTUH-O15-33]WNX83611.1 alpha/beta hydrolase [Agathobaculum sp. NTUH-O15-33]
MFGYEPEFVGCGDARIAYFDVGRGKPLILLHGNGEDSSYFKAQIPEFSRFYRVIAVDSRGHGQSERGSQGLSFALMAQDLKAVLDTLGIEKAFILGFSDGGNLAIKFALTYPQYVDKLILNGANVEMFRGIKPRIQLPLYPVYGLLSVLGKRSGKAAHKRDVLGLMVHPYGVKMEDLARITAPTLLIVGEHDLIREKQTREIAARIPDSRVEVFRDGDHFVAARQPARFNRTVIEFLMGR